MRDRVYEHPDAMSTGASTGALAQRLPLAVRCRQASRLVGVSPTTWRRLDDAGQIPAARRVGNSKVWMVDELRAWLLARCPSRERWKWQRAKCVPLVHTPEGSGA